MKPQTFLLIATGVILLLPAIYFVVGFAFFYDTSVPNPCFNVTEIRTTKENITYTEARMLAEEILYGSIEFSQKPAFPFVPWDEEARMYTFYDSTHVVYIMSRSTNETLNYLGGDCTQ